MWQQVLHFAELRRVTLAQIVGVKTPMPATVRSPLKRLGGDEVEQPAIVSGWVGRSRNRAMPSSSAA